MTKGGAWNDGIVGLSSTWRGAQIAAQGRNDIGIRCVKGERIKANTANKPRKRRNSAPKEPEAPAWGSDLDEKLASLIHSKVWHIGKCIDNRYDMSDWRSFMNWHFARKKKPDLYRAVLWIGMGGDGGTFSRFECIHNVNNSGYFKHCLEGLNKPAGTYRKFSGASIGHGIKVWIETGWPRKWKVKKIGEYGDSMPCAWR